MWLIEFKPGIHKNSHLFFSVTQKFVSHQNFGNFLVKFIQNSYNLSSNARNYFQKFPFSRFIQHWNLFFAFLSSFSLFFFYFSLLRSRWKKYQRKKKKTFILFPTNLHTAHFTFYFQKIRLKVQKLLKKFENFAIFLADVFRKKIKLQQS